jgi:hypothetical protein
MTKLLHRLIFWLGARRERDELVAELEHHRLQSEAALRAAGMPAGRRRTMGSDTTTDPVALAGAAVLMVPIAVLAGLMPARRATSVDPLIVFRAD